MNKYIYCEPKDKSKGLIYFKVPMTLKPMTNQKHIKAFINIKFNKDIFLV